MDKLKPVKTLSLSKGKNVKYRGISIARERRSGYLKINGAADPKCVEFRRNGGASSAWYCFAVLVGNQVLIFEGPQTGPGMLDRQTVLAACH